MNYEYSFVTRFWLTDTDDGKESTRRAAVDLKKDQYKGLNSTCKQLSVLETMFIKRVQALSFSFFLNINNIKKVTIANTSRFLLFSKQFLESSIQNIVIKASGKPTNSPRTTWCDCCFGGTCPSGGWSTCSGIGVSSVGSGSCSVLDSTSGVSSGFTCCRFLLYSTPWGDFRTT